MFSARSNSSTSPRRWRSSAMWLTPAASVSRGPSAGDVASGDAHRAVVGLAQPHDRLDQLALAVGVDAGDADDLARAHVERDAAHRGQPAVVTRREPVDLEQRLARLVLGLLDPQQHVAADHQPRQRALGRALGRHGVDHLAAPQDGHAVGDVEHLVELVRDEDDRRALLGQRAQDLEQVLRLLRGQHRGRLVEHEHLRAAEQRAQDLDALLGADAEVLDARLGVDRQAVALRELAHLAPRRSCSPAAGRCAARRRAPGSRPRSSPGRA